MLFSGTLRFNLDPFGEYATGSTAEEKLKTQDAALWAVLGTVRREGGARPKTLNSDTRLTRCDTHEFHRSGPNRATWPSVLTEIPVCHILEA